MRPIFASSMVLSLMACRAEFDGNAIYRLLPSDNPLVLKLEATYGSLLKPAITRKLLICAVPSDALEIGLKTGDFEIVTAALKIMKERQDQINVAACMGMIHDVLVWRIREYRILKWALVIGGVAGALVSETLAQKFDFFEDNLRIIQLSSVAGVGGLFLLFDHLQTAVVFNCLSNLRAVLQYPHRAAESDDAVDKSKVAIEKLAKQVAPALLPKT